MTAPGTARPPVRVEDGGGLLERLFGDRPINDGSALIHLDVPRQPAQGTLVAVLVEVNWTLVLTKAVARLYLIAERPRDPVLVRASLIPDMVPPQVCVKVRFDGPTLVRAVVECGDGTLLQVTRWVWGNATEPAADGAGVTGSTPDLPRRDRGEPGGAR
ncbi:MAG TPA: thiosulfate oxidation carrier protein SoxY [Methylomirabilota bacterium]|nr:thiosulfate oxidation carrier protein SoxY [Methylomirabilota bacterium]